MDIAAMSTMMSQASLANQVGASVLNITKDLMVQQGQALQNLMASSGASAIAMEHSVTPNLGSTIDIKL